MPRRCCVKNGPAGNAGSKLWQSPCGPRLVNAMLASGALSGAGQALRTMTDDEGLSPREVVDWCGSGGTMREITRLLTLDGGYQLCPRVAAWAVALGGTFGGVVAARMPGVTSVWKIRSICSGLIGASVFTHQVNKDR